MKRLGVTSNKEYMIMQNLFSDLTTQKFLNKCIVKPVISYEDSEGRYCIIMEYWENGDLENYINKKKSLKKSGKRVRLLEDRALEIFVQVLMAVSDTHSKLLIHRDIKDKNIFMWKDGSVRLGDFGAAKLRDSLYASTGTIIGDCSTMAPEVSTGGEDYDDQADIYSLGVVLFQLLYLRNYHDYINVKSRKELEFKKRKGMTDELYVLLKKMLIINPEKRIKLEDIFQIKLIQNAIIKVGEKFYKNGE